MVPSWGDGARLQAGGVLHQPVGIEEADELVRGQRVHPTRPELFLQAPAGLQAVANVAAAIRSGNISVGIAAGVESMSFGGGVAAPKQELPPANWGEIQENPLAREDVVSKSSRGWAPGLRGPPNRR